MGILEKLKARRERIKIEKIERTIVKDAEARKKLNEELVRLHKKEQTLDLELKVQRTKERVSEKQRKSSPFFGILGKVSKGVDKARKQS